MLGGLTVATPKVRTQTPLTILPVLLASKLVGCAAPDDKVQRYLVYLKYRTLNLNPLMVYPKVLIPPRFIFKAVQPGQPVSMPGWFDGLDKVTRQRVQYLSSCFPTADLDAVKTALEVSEADVELAREVIALRPPTPSHWQPSGATCFCPLWAAAGKLRHCLVALCIRCAATAGLQGNGAILRPGRQSAQGLYHCRMHCIRPVNVAVEVPLLYLPL